MYEQLKALINQYIKTNGSRQIKGAVLNNVLNEMVNSLGGASGYGGIITPTSQTPANDANIFYIAIQQGNYTAFGITVNAHELAFVKRSGNGWAKDAVPLGSGIVANPQGEATEQLSKIEIDGTVYQNPQGPAGRNGVDAVNPFKGWFDSLAKLKAAHTAIKGDSAYVKDASPATTWSIYVYDSTASSDNYWADSGTDADTSNVQTFKSGENVNEIGITQHSGNSAQILMTQKGVTDFVNIMQPEFSGDNNIVSKELTTTPISASIIQDAYISSTGVITAHSTPGTIRTDYVKVNEGDVIKMSFILHKVGSSEFKTIRFGYMTSIPDIGDIVSGLDYVRVPSTAGTHSVENEFVPPQDGYLCISYSYYTSNPTSNSYLSDVSYTVSFLKANTYKIGASVGKIQDSTNSVLEDSYISNTGEITSYDNPGLIHCDRLLVHAGDRVFMQAYFNHVISGEFINIRCALYQDLPQIGDNCIAGTLGFVSVPLDQTEENIFHVFDIQNDGYLAVSYQHTSSINTTLSDVNYTVVNYGARLGKLVSLGDSITYGYIPHGLEGNPDGQLESYSKIASDILNMNFVNYGISGNTLIGSNLQTAMCNRYVDMVDDADIVTFMGGTNDIRSSVPLGNMSDRVVEGDSSTYTYYAGCHKLVEGLYRKYILKSGRRVVLVGITPPKMISEPASAANGIGILYPNFDKWIEAFKEVCAYYGVTVCDFYNSGLLATQIASGWRNTAYNHTGYFNPLVPDGVHPSQIGQYYLGEFLADYLKNMTLPKS